ncbi:MAG: ComEC/Rec2 family competence protein [candidate division WOR-3 bacterium]|nr:MAG: ComEC/Rec2 family competence protein [candidate division WOR-3 bacterium]
MASIIVGIILQTSMEISVLCYLIATIVAVLLSLLRRRFLYLAVLTLSALNVYAIRPRGVALGERDAIFSGIVYGENQYERYSKLTVHIDRIILSGDTIDYRSKAHYYAFGHDAYFGKRLIVKGRLRQPRYGHQPLQLTGKIIGSSVQDHPFGMIFNRLRVYVDRLLKDLFRGEDYLVASGLVLGGSGRLPEALKEVFGRAGVLHIMAVSGLHVGFVGAFLGAILLFIPLDRRIKFVIIVCGLVVYAGVTGFRPSVVRATLMAFLFGTALALQRNVNGMHIVNVTGIIFLLYDPLLLFDVSVQLSFSAVYGILFLYPRIEEKVIKRVRRRLVRILLRPMAVSFSAQVFVAPFVIYYFHRLPLYAVLTNVMIVPLASMIIFLLLLCLAIGWMWFGVVRVIAFPVSILISVLVAISTSVARLPLAALRLTISPLLIFPFFCLCWRRIRKAAIWLTLTFVCLFSLARSIDNVTVCVAARGILITAPGGEHILLTDKVSAGQRAFLDEEGITDLDYLLSRSMDHPVKRGYAELPGKMQYAEMTHGDLKIHITDRVRIRYHDFEREYALGELERRSGRGLATYVLTDGESAHTVNHCIYGTVVDDAFFDLQLVLSRLAMVF